MGLRFDGWIAGIGTAGGTRLVVGHWPRSPFGPVSDVMREDPDGHRTLYAPTAEFAEFVASTYTFDEVSIVAVSVSRSRRRWVVEAGPLAVAFDIGRRGGLGWLLRSVPGPVARGARWAAVIDRPVRVALPGVRVRGTAGGGRREWYAATDLHRITAATTTSDGGDLGPLAPVDPPVRFGFGSTPRTPCVVRVVSTVEVTPTR